MNLSEAFATGGQTAVTGMGIVFGVLIILLIVLQLFKVIFYKDPAKTKTAAPVSEPEIKPEPETAAAEPEVEEDDEQLIAVITAAVAAALNTSTYKLNIKSIRRTGTSRSAWNKAGINETIGNRL